MPGFDGKFEVFQRDVASSGGGDCPDEFGGLFGYAGDIGLPAAGDGNAVVGEFLHGGEQLGGRWSVWLEAGGDVFARADEGELNYDVAQLTQEAEVGLGGDESRAGADDGGVLMVGEGGEECSADAVTKLGRLEGVAHAAEVEWHTAVEELTNDAGWLLIRESTVEDTRQGLGISWNYGIVRAVAAAIARIAEGALECATAVAVEAEWEATEEELAGKRQW